MVEEEAVVQRQHGIVERQNAATVDGVVNGCLRYTCMLLDTWVRYGATGGSGRPARAPGWGRTTELAVQALEQPLLVFDECFQCGRGEELAQAVLYLVRQLSGPVDVPLQPT